MSFCTSRNSDRHEVNGVGKSASSEVLQPTVASHEGIQLKSNINRLTSEQLGHLVKLIYTQEPDLNSPLKDLEVDIEKVKPSTVKAMQNFVAASLKKNSQNDSSEFHSSLRQIQSPPLLFKSSPCTLTYLMVCRKAGGET